MVALRLTSILISAEGETARIDELVKDEVAFEGFIVRLLGVLAALAAAGRLIVGVVLLFWRDRVGNVAQESRLRLHHAYRRLQLRQHQGLLQFCCAI